MNLISKKNYSGIDFFKFCMAVFVVAIHTHPLEGLHENEFTQSCNGIVAVAVPYFFIASGFLLFLKVNTKQDKESQLLDIYHYTVKIVKRYLYWTIIFLPITIWKFSINEASLFKDFLMFIRGITLIGENYYSWPLWYLLSTMYSLIFIYCCIYKNQKTAAIVAFSVVLFLISISMDFVLDNKNRNTLFCQLSYLLSFTFGNGRLFSGLLYLMIGALFAKNTINFQNRIWMLLFLTGFIFQVFYLPFVSAFLFVLLPSTLFYVSINLDLKWFRYGIFFRKSSTVMYFTHMIIFFLYTLIFKEFDYFGWDAFLVSVLIPVLLTPVLIRYENRYLLLKKIF